MKGEMKGWSKSGSSGALRRHSQAITIFIWCSWFYPIWQNESLVWIPQDRVGRLCNGSALLGGDVC